MLKSKQIQHWFAVLSIVLSGQSFAGVDEGDLPPSITNSQAYGGTVKTLIDQQRQSILQEKIEATPSQSTPVMGGQGESNLLLSIPDVVFVGMHETAEGDRIAEVYFQGNILPYQKGEQLPNKERITTIEDRVLTTTERQYWLSPTPKNTPGAASSGGGLPGIPLGLIQ